MPPQNPNSPKDKETTPIQSVNQGASDDTALREDWNKLSKDDKDRYFQSLPAEDQVQFAQRVGMFDHKGLTMSVGPQWSSVKTEGMPFAVKAPSPAWLKEKAYQILDWGANQLPTVGGMVGGPAGTAVGEGIDPAGGGVPGALVGSAVGGGVGEAARQGIFHLQGYDQYDDPETKTLGARINDMAWQGAGQFAAEATGQAIGRAMRPTLERSLAKLYNAGGIDYGDGMGEGRLKTVFNDLQATEKAPGGKALTIQDLVNTIDKTKQDVGARADAALSAPVNVGGKVVLLKDMSPDPTPLADLIKSFATKDEGVVKRASLGGADPSVTAAKKYQKMVRDRALTFEQQPWTYGQLARERIRIGRELDDYYAMTPGEKQAFLSKNPLFEVDKAIADYIRKVTYPEMDKVANLPKGTTANLQIKRGILMGMDTEVRKSLQAMQNKTVKAQGEGLVDKISPSGYVTSEGKPGGSFHRIQRLIHTPNGMASADKKVSQAFGHAPLTVVRKSITTPFGSKTAGNEILSLPVRALIDWYSYQSHPENQEPAVPQASGSTPLGPQSSAAPTASPRELLDKARQLNPIPKGPVTYAHTAVNPQTGHKIGSNGQNWFDVVTGEKVV